MAEPKLKKCKCGEPLILSDNHIICNHYYNNITYALKLIEEQQKENDEQNI